jgi:fructosamine-3-kinase
MSSCRSDDPVASAIAAKTGLEVQDSKGIGTSGWSSQSIYRTTDGQTFFAKMSRRRASEMFEGEALGLQAMYGVQQLIISNIKIIDS